MQLLYYQLINQYSSNKNVVDVFGFLTKKWNNEDFFLNCACNNMNDLFANLKNSFQILEYVSSEFFFMLFTMWWLETQSIFKCVIINNFSYITFLS